MQDLDFKNSIEGIEETFAAFEKQFARYRKDSEKFILEREKAFAKCNAERIALDFQLKKAQSNFGYIFVELINRAFQKFIYSLAPSFGFNLRAKRVLRDLGLNPDLDYSYFVFDLNFYECQDGSQNSGTCNQLGHYLKFGEKNGLWPNKYFDPKFYEKENPHIRFGNSCRLLHFLEYGLMSGSVPSKLERDFVFEAAKANVTPAVFLANKYSLTTSKTSPNIEQ